LKSILAALAAWVCMVGSGAYLLNLGCGVKEFLPDDLRLTGHLDEFVAALVFFSAARFFGTDYCRFFPKRDHGAAVRCRT
jgi:hypothetical protein